MKNFFPFLISLASFIFFSTVSFAQIMGEKVLSSRSVTLPVDLSLAKLKYTNAGYGDVFHVKILVPELAAETIMNHRNEGEGAPCLATFNTYNLNDVLQGHPEVISSDFTITLSKIVQPTSDDKCSVTLRETIDTKVRGFKFSHVRDHLMPERELQDCK